MRRTDFLGSYQMHSTAKFTIFAMNFLQTFIGNKFPEQQLSKIILMGDDPTYSIAMLQFMHEINWRNESMILASIDAAIEQSIRNAKKKHEDLKK